MHRLFLKMLGTAVLSAVGVSTGAQVSGEATREQIRKVVRSQLHLESDRFLAIQRIEMLEQLLAVARGRPGAFEFYQVSQAGDEVKQNSVVHHIFMDVDPTYIVALNVADGSAYFINGFTHSPAEFERLMTAAKVKVSSPDQAELVAELYRDVNPERHSLLPLSSLLDLKQAAERQCQAVPFDPNEREFEAWWKQAKPLYAKVPFRQSAIPSGSGYIVEWITLSRDAPGNCGGAALRIRLEVGSNGHVGQITFTPVRKTE